MYHRQTAGAFRETPLLWDSAEFAKVTRKSVSRSDSQELDDIPSALDQAVLDAYNWPHTLTDEEILEHLLALNLQRAAGYGAWMVNGRTH